MNELELTKNAFVAAHGRFGDAEAARIPEQWYASLGETLWWIVALDEHYRGFGKEGYEVYRNNDQYGSVILGLRFARNLVGHHIAYLVSDPYGGHFLSGKKPQREYFPSNN